MSTTRDIESELDDIRRRLKVSRQRSIAAAVIALVVAAVWVGDTVFERWIAKKGHLGGRDLVLNSPDGKMRGVLGARNRGSALVLRNVAGDPSAGLAVGEDGMSCLLLSNKAHGHAKLSVPSDGGPFLKFSRATGETALACGESTEGRSYMVLCAEDGKPRIVMQVDADGSPRIEIRDAEGNVIWGAP